MDNKRKYIWASVTVAILIMLMVISGSSDITSGAKNAVSVVLSPINSSVSFIYNKFNEATDFLFGSKELREDYNRLNIENEELKEELALYQEVIARKDFLEDEYNLMKKIQYDYIQANVIAENPDNVFGTFMINKGKKDGVKVGDIAISGVKYTESVYKEGLAGIVTEVRSNTSLVNSTLSDENSISFINARTLEKGIINSHARDGLKGYYFNAEADMKVGDKLLTSGMGGNYPKDLYIGDVIALNETDEFDGKLVVESKVDFDKLHRILIISKDDINEQN